MSSNPNTDSDYLKIPEFVLLALVFVATAVAAVFAGLQWRTAADNEQRSLRAYILLDTDSPFSSTPTDQFHILRIDIRGKNSGSTPAFSVEHHAWIATAHSLPADFDFSGPPNPAGPDQVPVPNGGLVRFHAQTAQPFTREEIAAITKGESRVYIFGSVLYKDTFDCRHHTNFCVWYSGEQPASGLEVTVCPRHNDAD